MTADSGVNEKGVFYDKHGKKTFVPLENNPEVFTQLVHALGVDPELGFFDVYSVDEPELLSLVPRPAHALIFIAPADVFHRVRALPEDANVGSKKQLTYDGSGEAEPIMWFPQTIGHACGLIALLHSVANGPARPYVLPGSDLDKLFVEALPLKPMPRADLLYNSEALENAHMDAAMKGDSVAPSSAEPSGYHFISFVKGKNGHLYELEGSSDGPIDRGALADDEDVLSENALNLGPRRFTKMAEGNVEFSIVALASQT